MENEQLKGKNIIKYRTYSFSLNVIDLLELLPRNYIFETIGKQLLRSATSIGANIIEAQAGKSRKDFANFYQIALKSSNETKYWLLIIKEKVKIVEVMDKSNILLQEAIEISNMIGASIITLKNK